ncbi:F0F1 ATP synthase subunit delta [Oceanicaulis sp. MMSF_3324]|uniref:F0F1 ATP synthase subunit delta n=1 Tax=Oceanicaulis sp. MMSF_3324 TaxID=3046702 RepID=UPI00273EA385|nr:F0F1 ATP synthase subunit delta [Oceanicaulis sp. MMSF_3324]
MTTVDNAIMSEAGERYARALFDLAEEAGAAEAVEKDVDALGAVLADSDDLRDALTSPLYGAAEKSSVLSALAEKLGAQDLTKKFIAVAAHNGRASDITDMLRAFKVLAALKRGATSAVVTTADELTATQLKELTAALKTALGQDVDIRTQVRPDILGGLIVKVGSRMFDSSLRTKLEGLRNTMKEA